MKAEQLKPTEWKGDLPPTKRGGFAPVLNPIRDQLRLKPGTWFRLGVAKDVKKDRVQLGKDFQTAVREDPTHTGRLLVFARFNPRPGLPAVSVVPDAW